MTAARRRDPLLGSEPTPAERAALFAVCQPSATEPSAARALNITERALHARLERLFRREGVNSAAQARHALARRDLHELTSTNSVPLE
jgi:hypothetical protein